VLLNRPGADDDADNDVDHTVEPPGLGISLSSVREAAYDDPTAVLAISEPSRRRRELWSPYTPETSTWPIKKISQLSAKTGGHDSSSLRYEALDNDAGEAPGVPAGRRRLGHATALDAGDLLPFKLRLPIHHTSLRLHRGLPRPRQHADWLHHRCVTTASFCCRSPPRLGLIRRGLRCGQASGENAARSAPCPRSRMAQPFAGAGLK
jgi:hypothetical protein